MTTERCALIIAVGFPPTGGAGVQRPAKFAKYLARTGWKTLVWSASDLPDLPVDPSLLIDLPSGVDRRAIRAWDPVRRCRRMVAPITRRLKRYSALANLLDGVAWRLGGAVRSLMRWGMPDEQVFWVLRSYRQVKRLVVRRRVNVIYSTFSPPSNHLLAYLLKRATGVAWVADFRDLWTDDCAYTGGSWLRRRVDRALQRRFLVGADAVVAVSEAQTRILAGHVPEQRHKFVTITNGVDLEDFDAAASMTAPSPILRLGRRIERPHPRSTRTEAPPTRGDATHRFVLAHVGQLQTSRVTEAYIEGLKRFVERLGAERRRFEFRVVGLMSAELRERFRSAGIEPAVTGYLPHREAVKEMRAADVLLLPTAQGINSATLIPGKLFEYLGSGRPMLVVGRSDCEPWRIVRRLGAGVRCDVNAESMETALTKLWRSWTSGSLPPGCRRADLTPYCRETLTQKLAALFDEVCHQRTNVASPLVGGASVNLFVTHEG